MTAFSLILPSVVDQTCDKKSAYMVGATLAVALSPLPCLWTAFALPPDAFVYSLTSFHGRGFFPGLETKPSLHDPLVMLAAIEAVIGLLIEISFIATFTQRFCGK